MITPEDVFQIGRLGRPHGVKGEITFQISDDVFDRVDAEYLLLELDGILVPFFMEEYRFKSDTTVLVKFCDIDSQEKARELTGCGVYFPRSETAGTDDGMLSWAEVVGYIVKDTTTGTTVGAICSVDTSTENVLFEVTDDGGGICLIPANPELIADIDTDSRTIAMSLPEGLLSI